MTTGLRYRSDFGILTQSSSLRALAICGALLWLTSAASAEVNMPLIFGDHMVLQKGEKIPVWGTGTPGEKIQVKLGKVHAKTRADASGNWLVGINTQKAGMGPLTMTVIATNTIAFNDVLIGDVWVASGQSNMAIELEHANTGAGAIKAGNQPMIRLFTVPLTTAAKPLNDIAAGEKVAGKWLVCSPESLALGFSAVGYFFGRDIQRITGMPVGLISTSVGGTPAQAWMSYEALQSAPQLAAYADSQRKLLDSYDATMAAFPQALQEFQQKHEAWLKTDKPQNDAALAKWYSDRAAAAAVGQKEPDRPALIPEPKKPDPSGGPGHPTALYNGMIAPIIPFGIKGVIWYQGEANAGKGAEYRYLFSALIQSWREKWGEGDFPFLFVQLPDYQFSWALLRESQLETLSLRNTGMVVSIDAGTIKNIHPPFKEVIGDRLALVAEHVAYGREIEYSGPIYKSMRVEDDAIRILFDHAEGLKTAKPPVSGPDTTEVPVDKLVTFTIAGEDKKWQPADATIDGDTVIVRSPNVKQPVAVRFGWDPPSICNLYNKSGLPASPFRTDDWQ
jgi:sialate O-acetylesterase